MTISIVTPHLNGGPWLRLCVASVADQHGVEVEHLVQDGGSVDGSLELLGTHPGLRVTVAKDDGMYDAINRGLRAATGTLVAHLNADEQYLPGALAAVAAEFEADPRLDILVADTVVVDADGEFICCRKSFKPMRLTRFADNPTITSSIFMRRSAVERHGLYFDTAWRIISDADWMRRCVTRRGLKIAVMRRYTSAFTETGGNLDLSPRALEESRAMRNRRPRWAKLLAPALKLVARLRRLAGGGYRQQPFHYEIFTLADETTRKRFVVTHPTCVWWTRAPRTAGGRYRRLKRMVGKSAGQRSSS
jgi:glycosyltransferase involved in cell wall biosynthesis